MQAPTPIRLYESKGSPSPRRVRLVLAEKGIAVEAELVSLADRAQFDPAFLAVNPRATVPVLALSDGTRLRDSHAIARYLEAAFPEPPLFGTSPVERALVEEWCRRVDLELYLPAADALRNGNPRFEGRALPGWASGLAQIPALVDRARLVAACGADAVDAALTERPYLALDRYSMADVDLLVAVDFAERVGLPLRAGRPGLTAWHERVSARPSVVAG